ncbi:hypothetical protein CLOM_g13314 [Closterium sp. NIES-68]|nr:hypothetical protein CLOM_g13314 [Closterium sp. NIES-68]GJP71402.1 hypothetical protein CLOP_g2236 [Closterium sp. NIES-67]
MAGESHPPSLAPLKGCKPHACAIQSCLKKNEYQPSRCTSPIRRLHECCMKLQAAGATSPHCAAVDAHLPRKDKADREGEPAEGLGKGCGGVKGDGGRK